MLSGGFKDYNRDSVRCFKKVTGTTLAIAKVCRFYGCSLSEINNMSTFEFSELIGAMEQLETIEQLRAIEVSAFPELDPKDKKNIHGALMSNLNTEKKTISMEEAVRFLTNGK